VHTAQTKPTGEANRSELLTMALEINSLLDAKAGTGVLDDDLSDEGGEFGGEAEVSEKDKVIHLTSDGEEAAEELSRALVVKGYRTANPLEVKTRGTRASTSQAVEAMSAISTYFSADRERERADRRAEARASIASNSVLMAQLQSAQTDLQEVRSELREVRSELREAHSENKRLSESLRAETHRADKLDLHAIRLQDKVEQLEAKNRELLAPDSESDSSPHERKRRRRHHHQLTPPSVSQKTVAVAPDGTKSPSINSPKAGVVALPARDDHSL
jgi:septal ring factor EnvC (AmiA/AmiB activator)